MLGHSRQKKVYNLGKHHALVLELYSNGIPKPEKACNLLQYKTRFYIAIN